MQHTSAPMALVTIPLTGPQQETLRKVSSDLQFTFSQASSANDIPAEVWRETEILFTFGNTIPSKEQAPNLRWVQLYSAGADHALHNPLFQTDTTFTTSSGVHSTIIGEYIITTILAWYHRLSTFYHLQQQRSWPSQREKMDMLTQEELRDKTIGIVGYGSIGREAARLASAFGMRVIALQRGDDHRDHGFIFSGTGDPDGLIPAHYFSSEQFHDLLAQSDVVVATVPLTQQTTHMFDAHAFSAMKDSAFFINIARGEICDQQALLQALQNHTIAGAALDVTDPEPLPSDNLLWTLPNVFITPHASGLTTRYTDRAIQIFTANLQAYLAHKTLYNVVDQEKGY
jgi:phosphoglycerate dehydrogenase-like enzyme